MHHGFAPGDYSVLRNLCARRCVAPLVTSPWHVLRKCRGQEVLVHRFHVPVMGIGFTIDSALRVAKLGISTVMSLADDRLIEKVRRHYCEVYGLPCTPITARDPDARANRIAAWLDLVGEVVARQVAELNAEPLEPGTDKWRYLALLPDSSELKQRALRGENVFLPPGAIDVNIMTKVDGATYAPDGMQRDAEHSLAKAALRGFARSRFGGSVALSAGVNPSLIGEPEQFEEFHRDASGHLAKPIILKVSDVRSALIQGKFLAK